MTIASSLVPTAPGHRVSINGIEFPINPQNIAEQQPAQVVMLPGLSGAIRQDYGDGPHTWTLQGHTGQGGLGAILKIQPLRDRRGQPAKAVTFLYPWKYGKKPFSVYVDDCTWEEQVSESAYYFHYTILLREAVPQSSQPPILKVT